MSDNQNDIRLRGITSFNPFAEYTSSSRMQMQAQAISQHYVINGCETNTILTGAELEYGKYTNSITVPHNIKVLNIVDRYITSNLNGIKINPQRIIIYQSVDNDNNTDRPLFGIIDVVRTSDNHVKFAYDFEPTENTQQIRVGNFISKGTVLYDTPAKDSFGNYQFGRNLNTLYSSLEGAMDDSILIAKDVVPYLKTKTITTSTFELGEKEFPLNLYGDDDNYKVMPDIGDYCIPTGQAYNGIVMAKRKYQPSLLPITFTKTTTRIFDPISDTPLDGGDSTARVVDIIVYRQSKSNNSLSPKVMEQIDKYANAYIDFCERIIREYKKIMAQTSGRAIFTDEFDQLIKKCMAITNEYTGDDKSKNVAIQKVSNFSRKLDDITIIITTECIKEVGPGFKITDIHGGKGVATEPVEVDPSEMPFDPVTGVRADIVISPETTWNRMNPGRIYEQSLKTSMFELENRLRAVTKLDKSTPDLKNKVFGLPKEILDDCIHTLGRFYEIVSSEHDIIFKSWSYQEKVLDLYHIIKDKIYIYLPHGNKRRMLDVFKSLKEEGYLSDPNRLKFWNSHLNRWEETLTPQRIGPVYYMCLEKIGGSAAAVSTAATQPNGIIVPLTFKDKNTQQVRKQATKFPGESEGRLLVNSGPSGLAAELHDRSNNPIAIEAALNTIYNTDTPTNIDVLIDRDKYPLGSNRPLQILRHYIQCNGCKLVYDTFDHTKQTLCQIDPITGRAYDMTIEDGASDEEEDLDDDGSDDNNDNNDNLEDDGTLDS